MGCRHAHLLTDAVEYLIQILEGRAVVRPDRPITLPRPRNSEPVPDIAVVRPPGRKYRNHHPYPGDIFWLIEFSDSSLARDLEEKRLLYAQAQVPEYWVVDLQKARLVVFRNPDGTDYCSSVTTTAGNKLTPLKLPGLCCSVRRLLQGS